MSGLFDQSTLTAGIRAVSRSYRRIPTASGFSRMKYAVARLCGVSAACSSIAGSRMKGTTTARISMPPSDKDPFVKFAEPRPYADPEAAMQKVLEIASTVKPVQDGRWMHKVRPM
jgi:hypothetical protein